MRFGDSHVDHIPLLMGCRDSHLSHMPLLMRFQDMKQLKIVDFGDSLQPRGNGFSVPEGLAREGILIFWQ